MTLNHQTSHPSKEEKVVPEYETVLNTISELKQKIDALPAWDPAKKQLESALAIFQSVYDKDIGKRKLDKDNIQVIKELKEIVDQKNNEISRIEKEKNNWIKESSEYKALTSKILKSRLIWTPWDIAYYKRAQITMNRLRDISSRASYYKVLKREFYGIRRAWYFRKPDAWQLIGERTWFNSTHEVEAKKNLPIQIHVINSERREITRNAMQKYMEANKDKFDDKKIQEVKNAKNPYEF